MVFLNKIARNFFAFVVVIKNTDNTVRKKPNLSNCFSSFPIIFVSFEFYFCRLACNQVYLLSVQITELQQVIYKFYHSTKLSNRLV